MKTINSHEADLILSSANLISKIEIEDDAIGYAIRAHKSKSLKVVFLITSMNLATRIKDIKKTKILVEQVLIY
jgi:hypothetical protein